MLVTEDVTGHALRQHITKASLSLTFDQKIAIVRDMLAALNHAHRSDPQVVHRNLTPDAVLVGESGRALVCGFDYARTGKGLFSTIAEEIVDELDPIYQAPECDKDPSQASVVSDLYAAGLVAVVRTADIRSSLGDVVEIYATRWISNDAGLGIVASTLWLTRQAYRSA